MKKYLHILKIATIEKLTYRARVFLWLSIDILEFVAFPFIWLVIYGSQNTIKGFDRADIVTYYAIIALVSTVASSHMSDGIKRDIMDGDINGILLRPISYLWHKTMEELSYRIMYLVLFLPILVALTFIFSKFIVHPATPLVWLFFAISLVLSFALSHGLQLMVGLAVFWIGETSALEQVRTITETIFSGKIAPLAFFPPLLGSIAFILPFKYLSYIPAQIYLNKLSMLDIITNTAYAFAWVAVICLIIVLLWKQGLKRYDGSSV
jgi:ABC-2 type transport system permease protein